MMSSWIPRIKLMIWMGRMRIELSSIMYLMPVLIWKNRLIFRFNLLCIVIFIMFPHMMTMMVMMASMMTSISTSASHIVLTIIIKSIEGFFHLISLIMILRLNRLVGLCIGIVVICRGLSCLHLLQLLIHLSKIKCILFSIVRLLW